jgi:predicted NBD/HSP70 family sugar kinase
MADAARAEQPLSLTHGAERLPLVTVDTYNEELRDSEGFIGDRASSRAFRAILDEWRDRVAGSGDDPLGEKPSGAIPKKKLDRVLREGDPLAAGVVHTAIENFASELATVTERFLRVKGWRGTERIVVGGGLRASRVGELAIGRAAVLVKAAGHALDLVPICHDPDEAGLIGCIHLAPSWLLAGFDGMLAVDIGGSNIRAGIVLPHLDEVPDLTGCTVHASELWRHADESPKPKREDAVKRLVEILQRLVKLAGKDGLRLAPLVGMACPGVIAANGTIERGGQNLPGNWESSRFNLATSVKAGLPCIDGHDTHVIIHNDAVVQGLSQAPFMRDVERWGVLTIGTGLGNARFTNIELPPPPSSQAVPSSR